MATLRVHKARKHLFDFPLSDLETIVGRSETADVSLSGEAVSRKHAVITRQGPGYVVEDLSQNGMFVNGRTVKRHALADGDKVEIAQYILVFRLGDEADELIDSVIHKPKIKVSRRAQHAAPAPEREESTAFVQAIDMKRLRDGVAARRKAHLALLAEGTRHEYMLGEEHLLGWHPDCDIRFPGRKWFAKFAAYLWQTESGDYQIEQESMWRVVHVNGQKVDLCTLQDGDEIEVSGAKMRFFAEVD